MLEMEWRRKTEDEAQREIQKWVAVGVEIAMESVKRYLEDHRYRKPSTGNLANNRGHPPLCFSGVVRFTFSSFFCIFNALALFDYYSCYS